MSDIHKRFEHWYNYTHWMAPTLDKSDGRYMNAIVQAMFMAYRAGFHRARKEGKENLRFEMECKRLLNQ